MDISEENSKKLDLVITLLRGEPGAPGLLARQSLDEETLYGTKGNIGLVNKVNIMWRIHVWVLCTMSALAGYSLNNIVQGALRVSQHAATIITKP